MILSDTEILRAMESGVIKIDPFDRNCLGSNSYDVHLSKHISVYKSDSIFKGMPIELDSLAKNPTEEIEIPHNGMVLQPGTLYLASTVEYTECHKHVPFLEGKSSIGRLGINIHATAGKGDVGFCNYWTMEISVIHPVRIHAHMKIGQLIFFQVCGEVSNPYHRKVSAKYNTVSSKPIESRLYKEVNPN